MDKWRQALDKMRTGVRGTYFDLTDGGRYYLEPEPILSTERWAFIMSCVEADVERHMRPEPHEHFRMMCKAKDRLQAIRTFYPEWAPHKTDNYMCPYKLLVLFHEGRLEDNPFAEDGWSEEDENVWEEVHPIPYVAETG